MVAGSPFGLFRSWVAWEKSACSGIDGCWLPTKTRQRRDPAALKQLSFKARAVVMGTYFFAALWSGDPTLVVNWLICVVC